MSFLRKRPFHSFSQKLRPHLTDQASRGKGPFNQPMDRTILVSDVCGIEFLPHTHDLGQVIYLIQVSVSSPVTQGEQQQWIQGCDRALG